MSMKFNEDFTVSINISNKSTYATWNHKCINILTMDPIKWENWDGCVECRGGFYCVDVVLHFTQ